MRRGFQAPARHRPRPRTHRGDGGAPGRQQRRGRARVGRQSADRGDHRLASDQRARQARAPERRVIDGGRPRLAVRDRHRRALGQVAAKAPVQSLCVARLSGLAEHSGDRRRLVFTLREERSPARRRNHRPRPSRRSRRRYSRWGRQSLLQRTARRHHPLFRSRLHRSEVYCHVGGRPLGRAFDRAPASSSASGGWASIAWTSGATPRS
jgi:hypothetical protein